MENVYYLNKKGRELIGSTKIITKTPNYLHTLMKNDVYVHYGCPQLWQSEYVIPTNEGQIVADAIFQVQGTQYFLEVDRLQKMNVNFEKLRKYKYFMDSGVWQTHNNGQFPRVIFYTNRDSRRWQLTEKNPGIPLLVITKEDLFN